MEKNRIEEVVKCGKPFNYDIPCKLSRDANPIQLGEVTINPQKALTPKILINYSQNLTFSYSGENPVLSMTYQLVRVSNQTKEVRVLEQWTYRVSEVVGTDVPELVTIEPLVLNYCDALDCHCNKTYTYIVELSEINALNTSFKISNVEISAISGI